MLAVDEQDARIAKSFDGLLEELTEAEARDVVRIVRAVLRDHDRALVMRHAERVGR